MAFTDTRMTRALDIFGKFLLCWFGFSTLIYFWSGRFFTELENIPMSIRSGSIGGPSTMSSVCFSVLFAIFVMVRLLLRGSWLGFFVALLYWGIGYILNPFWYLFPQEWQGSEREGPMVLLYAH